LSSTEKFHQTFPSANKAFDNVLSKVQAKKKKKIQRRLIACSTIDIKDSCSSVAQVKDPSESDRKDECNMQLVMTENKLSAPQALGMLFLKNHCA
jgi:hypothetical protein